MASKHVDSELCQMLHTQTSFTVLTAALECLSSSRAAHICMQNLVAVMGHMSSSTNVQQAEYERT